MFKKTRLFVTKHKKAFMMGVPAVVAPVLAVVPAFAAEGTTGTNGVAITTEMLQPLISGVSANIAVILPVGIGIFAIMLGINLVPKLIKKFTKG